MPDKWEEAGGGSGNSDLVYKGEAVAVGGEDYIEVDIDMSSFKGVLMKFLWVNGGGNVSLYMSYNDGNRVQGRAVGTEDFENSLNYIVQASGDVAITSVVTTSGRLRGFVDCGAMADGADRFFISECRGRRIGGTTDPAYIQRNLVGEMLTQPAPATAITSFGIKSGGSGQLGAGSRVRVWGYAR